MASGKSTLGRALALAVHIPFVDLDQAVEAECGMSVADIFRTRGEEAFRQAESRLLRQHARQGCVIACGGGTPCAADNMDFMMSAGTVVLLDTGTETTIRRILEAPAGSRPLVDRFRGDIAALTDAVRKMKDERAQHYCRAHFTFDSTRLETRQQIDDSVKRFLTEVNY